MVYVRIDCFAARLGSLQLPSYQYKRHRSIVPSGHSWNVGLPRFRHSIRCQMRIDRARRIVRLSASEFHLGPYSNNIFKIFSDPLPLLTQKITSLRLIRPFNPPPPVNVILASPLGSGSTRVETRVTLGAVGRREERGKSEGGVGQAA